MRDPTERESVDDDAPGPVAPPPGRVGAPGRVEVAGRSVRSTGVTVAGLRTSGMWGQPSGRAEAAEVIRAAAESGPILIEVPLPFGPWADLARGALGDRDDSGVLLAARLTGALPGPEAVTGRLGRRPGLLLVAPDLLAVARSWKLAPVGALVPAGIARTPGRAGDPATTGDRAGAAGAGLAALRGGAPSARLLEWCVSMDVPYLGTGVTGSAGGARTVEMSAPATLADVERLLGADATARGGERR